MVLEKEACQPGLVDIELYAREPTRVVHWIYETESTIEPHKTNFYGLSNTTLYW